MARALQNANVKLSGRRRATGRAKDRTYAANTMKVVRIYVMIMPPR
jgi:hypothetical protein